MGRTHQEHLAQQVALRSTMPSTSNEVAWLRAQLALRDAQIEQVKAQRDSHFVQDEEEVLAHMRLLSSEAKDWQSRVVTEAEQVLCRENAQMAHQATEVQEAMDQHYKAKWQQAETDLKTLCKSNSAQVQSFASKMHETNAEHQQLHDAQDKRDEYNSRHKPFEKPTSLNNKQRKQLKNIKIWYRHYAVMQMINRIRRSFYGRGISVSKQTTALRSMSSTRNCST